MLKSLGWCCLGKVDLRRVAGGAAKVLLVSLSCPLLLLRTHPRPFIASPLLFYFRGDESNQYSFWTAGGEPIFCLRSGVERAN